MVTKIKWLAKIICLLTAVLCIVVLASCDDSCSHSWGKWTVTTNATCTKSGVQERKCLKCGEKETSAVEALGHDWNNATCLEPKTCKTCSATEGSASGHTPNADDGDCTTDVLCSVCGAVTTSGNATHTGGEATCVNKAHCENCGTEYGDLAEHTPEADDGDCTTDVLCSICGVVTTSGNATHTGGEATCVNKANCSICGTEYGDLAEHIPEADDGDCTTDVHCSICGAVTENTAHTGGEATCTNRAVCEICGAEYGDLADHIPEADDGNCTTDVHCSICGAVTTSGNATHTGGEASCTNRAVCDICGIEYGDLADHTPEADDGNCTTDVHCSVCGAVTTPGKATHTGGEATCVNKANCSICGTEYGDLADHIPEADDGDCTTDIHCSICGAVTTPGNEEYEDNSAIMLPSVEAVPGENRVSVAVSIRNNPGITGLTITVQYNSDFFTLTDAQSGDALDALVFTKPNSLNSGCTFLWDAEKIENEDIENGEMLILTFDVSSSAPEGTYSILLNVSAFDNDLNPVSLIITGGKIVVKNN